MERRLVHQRREQILEMATNALEAMECSGFAADTPSKLVIGRPDKIWVLDENLPAVVYFIVKSPWRLKDMTNIIEQSASENCDPYLRASIEQISVYMAVSA